MISKAFRYKGALAGLRRLDRHLRKTDGQRPELSETRNLFVPGSDAGLRVMLCLQQASKAEIVCWHIIVSPATTLRKSDRTRVVNMIVAELRAETHPLMIWSHNDKPRARRGGGASHWHLVLGHISPVTFHALDMRNYVQRLHKVMAVAAFDIEGVLAVSPFHQSIARHLRNEGRSDVANWLADLAKEAPHPAYSRTTDTMRRAAAAANFELAPFQAQFLNLWNSAAPEADFLGFLSGHGISVRQGSRSTKSILFYRGTLLVAVMNRLLQRECSSVFEEATARFPNLFNKHGTAPVRLKGDGVPKQSREVALRRQEKVDRLEEMLSAMKTEALKLIYDPSWRSTFSERSARTVDERIKDLLDNSPILETAIGLLWCDDRWASVPITDLLRYAKSPLGPDKASVLARSAICDDEAELTREDVFEEDADEIPPGPRPM